MIIHGNMYYFQALFSGCPMSERSNQRKYPDDQSDDPTPRRETTDDRTDDLTQNQVWTRARESHCAPEGLRIACARCGRGWRWSDAVGRYATEFEVWMLHPVELRARC